MVAWLVPSLLMPVTRWQLHWLLLPRVTGTVWAARRQQALQAVGKVQAVLCPVKLHSRGTQVVATLGSTH